MRELHYILDGAGNPVPEPNVIAWAQWYEQHIAERIVAKTDLPGDVHVSTVFLGLDHGFGGEPLLFETMIFGGELDETQDRYTTRAAAEDGHRRYVEQARAAQEGGDRAS